MSANSRAAAKAILLGGFIAGTIDIGAACYARGSARE